jgi:hypothetical protein
MSTDRITLNQNQKVHCSSINEISIVLRKAFRPWPFTVANADGKVNILSPGVHYDERSTDKEPNVWNFVGNLVPPAVRATNAGIVMNDRQNWMLRIK